MTLQDYGWSAAMEKAAQPYTQSGLLRGRVLEAQRTTWTVIAESATGLQELMAQGNGDIRLHGADAAKRPVTGDWVLLSHDGNAHSPAIIQHILPRRSQFSRKAPGDTAHDRIDQQVIASNIDVALVVSASGQDWNIRRIERYITLVWESGAQPIVVITKIDLADDREYVVRETEAVAPGVPVIALSAKTGENMSALSAFLKAGKTAVLLGSSGAGKSTLLNALAGKELQRTQEVRLDDERGRHTTTARTLFRLSSGALLIDTPGLRELQLWSDEDSLAETFPEIDSLAERCRFRDCKHEEEPGCAVREAIESGELSKDRFGAWKKLQREIAFLERRGNRMAELAEQERWKKINRSIRNFKKETKGLR